MNGFTQAAKLGLDITVFLEYVVCDETLVHCSMSRGASVFSIRCGRLVDGESDQCLRLLPERT